MIFSMIFVPVPSHETLRKTRCHYGYHNKAGYIKQILISQDIWNKHQRRKYGGWGYDHILRNAVPVMRAKGMTEEQIRTLLVENPRRVYTFV